MSMWFSKFGVWASSNECAEMESCFSKTTLFFGSNRMVSDIMNGQRVRMESFDHYIYIMIMSNLSLSHGFKQLIMSPSDFVTVAQTHAYSFLRMMVFYFELVGLSMNVENIVELGRPTFPEIFVRLPAWLLYSFLAWIFLQWVDLEKEYKKRN